MNFAGGETDAIFMQHHFKLGFPDDGKVVMEEWKLNLIAMGDAKAGKTAMALTVGTPTAIGAQLILDGVIKKKGLLDSTMKEVYDPIMDELQKYHIRFQCQRVDQF
jgi:saccharopine dehydrogenase-like NADP-dependent oxidoreductase